MYFWIYWQLLKEFCPFVEHRCHWTCLVRRVLFDKRAFWKTINTENKRKNPTFRSNFYNLENEVVMTSKRRNFFFFRLFSSSFQKVYSSNSFFRVYWPSRRCGRNPPTLKTNISQCELNKQIQVIILCLFYGYAHLYPLPATKETKSKYNHIIIIISQLYCNRSKTIYSGATSTEVPSEL